VGPLAARLSGLDRQWGPDIPGRRSSAVLALLSADDDPQLLLTLRDPGLAHHGGQISLPGGGREELDRSPADTACRETYEEIGLPPARIDLIGQMDSRGLPVSRNQVVPVVGLWSGHDELGIDTTEVEQVLFWPVSLLADPAYRMTARHRSGYSGPAWQIDELFLWGFTAQLVDALLELGGWAGPWDGGRTTDVPPRFLGFNSEV